VCVALTAMVGCANLSARYAGNEASPYYVVPTGSRLTLNQEITIPAGEVSVFIQDSRVLPFADVKKYYPHCKFELYTLRDNARAVAPDEFIVTKVVQEEADSADAGTWTTARISLVRHANMDSGGPSIRAYVTRMRLQSAKQPDVFRVSCAQWAIPPDGQHVTIAEMRRALGDVMSIRLAGPGG